jgi:protein CpxP
MKRKIVIGAAAVLVVALGIAVAQEHRRAKQWGPGMPGHIMAHLARKLNLTDAQKTQVKGIWTAEKPTVVPMLKQLADTHKQLAALSTQGEFNEAQVRPLANQQAQTMANLIVERQKMMSEVEKILTPEQRTKLNEMRQKRMQHMDAMLQRLESSNTSAQQ